LSWFPLTCGELWLIGRGCPRENLTNRLSVKDKSYTEKLQYTSNGVSFYQPSAEWLPNGYKNATQVLLAPCSSVNDTDAVAMVGRRLLTEFGGAVKCFETLADMEAYHMQNYVHVYGGVVFNNPATLLTVGTCALSGVGVFPAHACARRLQVPTPRTR
jgi:hypothetical protein